MFKSVHESLLLKVTHLKTLVIGHCATFYCNESGGNLTGRKNQTGYQKRAELYGSKVQSRLEHDDTES